MYESYLKIAIRSISRNRLFSAINILGLAVGIATCLTILLLIRYELSFDRYNEKADRIVRVVFKGTVRGQQMNEAHVMPGVAAVLKNAYPEVRQATRLRVGGYPRIRHNGKSFREDALVFVDSNFFQVFSLGFVNGDRNTVLSAPNSLVISEAIARKYFAGEEPVGKMLTFDSGTNYLVTGVIKDVPATSHFRFGLFASMNGLEEARDPSWMRSEFFTYLVLPEGYDYRVLESKLKATVDKYIGAQMHQAMGISLADFRKAGNDIGLFLQPLTDIHLYSDFAYDLSPPGDITYIYIFSAIAVFMLLIACTNFMNLSTAGAMRRAREVGVRKVLGSSRLQLVKQFMLESLLLTFLALAIAVALTGATLPYFNALSGREFGSDLSDHPGIIWMLLVTGLVTGILAGTYPAFFLASFRPSAVLKGVTATGGKSLTLRSGLVIFQFLVAGVLITGTAVVYRQLDFIRNKDLGYARDQVLVLRETGRLGNRQETFRREIGKLPGVISVSNSGYLPAGPSNNNNFFIFPGSDPSRQIKTLRYDVDPRYIPTLGMQILAGRNFSEDLAGDSSAVILNEAAVRALGWTRNPVGREVSRSDNDGNKRTYTVIGLVRDFHFRSLHEAISPLVMVLGPGDGLVVKMEKNRVAGVLKEVQDKWAAFSPEEPFTYAFLDQKYMEQYESERRMGEVLGIFAILTILIACLGLFGLATFAAEQRTREIGIRKVLGASLADILKLLSRDFVRLVLVANLLAWPLAYVIMENWLRDFAYRIHISWWFFAVSGTATFLIALITIGIRAFKAGTANPVKSLRTE